MSNSNAIIEIRSDQEIGSLGDINIIMTLGIEITKTLPVNPLD